ncbi:hypothetical protein E4T48_06646 [Aureobasidium sp. EXF-10727]|nr:hypothetical protein E4T48_06646 [Aureobasidium sp. EXF-10727]
MDNHNTEANPSGDYIEDSLDKAEELWNQGAFEECMKLLHEIVEEHGHEMGRLSKMRSLIMLCMLVDDWTYCESCRLEAEEVWFELAMVLEGNQGPDDQTMMADYRHSLDHLKDFQANNRPAGDGYFEPDEEDAEKPVAEMTDSEVEYRLKMIGSVIKIKGPGPDNNRTYEELVRELNANARQALEEYYARQRTLPSSTTRKETKPPTPSHTRQPSAQKESQGIPYRPRPDAPEFKPKDAVKSVAKKESPKKPSLSTPRGKGRK